MKFSWPFNTPDKTTDTHDIAGKQQQESVSRQRTMDEELESLIHRAVSHFPFENEKIKELILSPIESIQLMYGSKGIESIPKFSGNNGAVHFLAALASYCMQSAAGAVFCLNAPPRLRMRHQALWQYAAFVGGLGLGMRKELSETVGSAVELGTKLNLDLNSIFAEEPLIIPTLLSAVNGNVYHGGKRFFDVLSNMYMRITYDEYQTQAEPVELPSDFIFSTNESSNNDDPQLDEQSSIVEVKLPKQAKRIFDEEILPAMKELAKTSARWRFNEPGGRFWAAYDGLYVIWPPAAKDIAAHFKANNKPDYVIDFDILEFLQESKTFERKSLEAPYTMIVPPNQTTRFHAIKICDDNFIKTVFGGMPQTLPVAVAAGN